MSFRVRISGLLRWERLLLATTVFCLSAGPVRAAQGKLSYLSSTGWSQLNRVAIDDSLAYVSAPYGLEVFNLNDPTNLRPISQLFMQQGLSVGVRVQKGMKRVVTVSGNQDTLHVIDIHNPLSPKILGSFVLPSPAYTLWLEDTLAVMGCEQRIIAVCNIADPDHIACRADTVPFYLLNVAIRDTLIYAASFNGLTIISYGATAFSVLGRISSEDFIPVCMDLPDSDSLVYVADGDAMWPACVSALTVVNAADPANPKVIGRHYMYGLSGYANDIQVRGQTAYITCGYGGIRVIDVSDPTNPDSVATIPVIYFSDNLDINEGRLVTIARGPQFFDLTCVHAICPEWHPRTMSVVDVSQPSDPILLGQYDIPGLPSDVMVSGTMLVTLDGSAVGWPVSVFDVSDPAHCRKLGITTTYMQPWDGVLVDSLLLVADDSVIQIFNLADHSRPVSIGQTESIGSVRRHSLAVQWPYAYVATDVPGFTVCDLSDPTRPKAVGSCEVNAWSLGTAVSGSYAYVASDSTVAVVDVTDPTQPHLVTNVGHGSYQQALMAGNRLIVRTKSEVQLFSLADPVNPEVIKQGVFTADTIIDMIVDGETLYLACGHNGVKVADLANPDSIVLIDSFDTPAAASGLALDSEHLFVADQYGLIVLNRNGTTSVDHSHKDQLPSRYVLHQNYPNPFNPSTVIEYDIPRRATVTLDVLDILGRRVTRLVSGVRNAGHYRARFDGLHLASGAYFCRLSVDGQEVGVTTMLLVK